MQTSERKPVVILYDPSSSGETDPSYGVQGSVHRLLEIMCESDIDIIPFCGDAIHDVDELLSHAKEADALLAPSSLWDKEGHPSPDHDLMWSQTIRLIRAINPSIAIFLVCDERTSPSLSLPCVQTLSCWADIPIIEWLSQIRESFHNPQEAFA